MPIKTLMPDWLRLHRCSGGTTLQEVAFYRFKPWFSKALQNTMKHTVGMMNVLAVLLVILTVLSHVESSNLIHLQAGLRYKYYYEATTELENVGIISTRAKIHIQLLEDTAAGQHCLLLIDEIAYGALRKQEEGKLGRFDVASDFSQWFSFIISEHGEINRVYYPEEDNPEIVVLKKLLIGTLSAKLHSTAGALAKGSPWSYKVNETGHEGSHESTYTVNQVDNGLLFQKKKHGHVVQNANASFIKGVLYDHYLQLPHTVDVTEHFTAPRRVKTENAEKLQNLTEEYIEDNNKDAPDMHGNSRSTLRYIGQSDARFHSNYTEKPNNLVEDSLKIGKIPLPKVPLSEIESFIDGNMTCMQRHSSTISPERSRCFKNIVFMVTNLPDEDIRILGKRFLRHPDSQNFEKVGIVVDALGASSTHVAQDFLVDFVMLSPAANASLIVRTLTHFVGLNEPPTEKAISAIHDIAFKTSSLFNDPNDIDTVHNRATLVLGSIARCLGKADDMKHSDRGKRIVNKLEDYLGVHDPWDHRRQRSVLTEVEYKRHIEGKATLIYSLGNAMYSSSFEHFISYVNNSDSHPMLRRSAVHAISRYEINEAIETLMLSAKYDDDETVRYMAGLEYSRHPFTKDEDKMAIFNINNTEYVADGHLNRIRRGFWDGFRIRLKVPGIDWTREIGTNDIGAGMGLILKNTFDLNIKPLEGSIKVEINDRAFVRAHIGYIALEYTLLDAKVCFRGDAQYSLNILQEFGFSDIKSLVNLFDTVINKVVTPIKTALITFKELLSPDAVSFAQRFQNFIDAVKDLPNRVKDTRGLARTTLSRIGNYTGLPQYFTDFQFVILRMSGLFNAVKSDVMEFYNSINDAITIILPWAVEQVSEALKTAVEALKKLFKSPISAIKDIARFILQIRGAVSGLIRAKDRIADACFFAEGKQPYWFDLKTELTEILEDIDAVKTAIESSEDWAVDEDDDNIKQFTGTSGAFVRGYIVADILQLFDIMEGPITELQKLAEPFIRTHESVYNVIEAIKEGYEAIKLGYELAKTFLNKIFGSKGAKEFPRKIAETSCGDGFYPSTMGSANPGIDLEISEGSVLVAPFTGEVTRTGPTQMTMVISEELKDTEIIIDNVALYENSQDRLVFKGIKLGVVTSSGCSPNSIHMAMRKIGTDDYVDPSKFIEKRKMLTPKWDQSCDEYVVILKNEVVAGPKVITGGGKQTDESPKRTEEPDLNDLEQTVSKRDADRQRLKRSILDPGVSSNGGDFLDKLGLSKIDDRGPIFDFSVKDISIKNVLEFLADANEDTLLQELESLTTSVKKSLSSRDFKRPETMMDEELRLSANARGKDERRSSRAALLRQYREPEERCHHLWKDMPKDTYCNFDEDCFGVYCGVEVGLYYFPVAVPVSIRIHSCHITITVADYSIDLDISDLVEDGPFYDDGVAMARVEIFDDVQLEYGLSVTPNYNLLQFSLDLKMCSMIAESCQTPVSVFKDLELEVQGCDKIQVPGEAEFDVLGLTLENFQRSVDLLGFDESKISKLMNNILTIVTSKVIDLISTKLLNDYDNEFESFDIKLSGTFRFGHEVKFFEYSYVFALGPVPCKFGFGAGGSFGVSATADLALLSMTLTLKVTPQIGASVWGSVGLRIPLFSIEMKLIGYIVTTKLPTQAQLQFDHFPVDIKSRMDLVLVPLKLELRALVIFRINLLFKKIEKVLVDKLLWSYTTRQIEANIFNRGDLDPDRSPPTFTTVARGKDTFLSGDGKKRAPAHVTDCVVKQVPGRDYLDPAFELAIAVADEKSEVDLTFCVGSYKSGCDLMNNQPMGGPSVVIAQVLPGGVVTHFTVKATDSAGNMAMATCSLPTYDVTLPGGRVTPDFYSTSRPDVLRASAVVYDDSPLISQKEGIGFGYGTFSDQIIPWNDVTTNAMTESVESQSDPLSRFTKDRLGRLGLSPLEVASYGRKSDCAAHCLRVPSNKCLSFNYDFGTSGRCELLPGIEGLEIDLHESGRFHYYEKLGVGRLLQLNHNNLDLRHRDVHYINIHAVNALGYDNIISSKPVIADFSPPEPGYIENEAMDKVSYEHCVDYVPDEWEFRCVDTTQLKNHRFIIDGPGSKTVFNGHKPSFDLKYTRANRYISANWDGYHDDETGIYGYTWTIGSEACLEDVHPHKDPHSHFFDESEWTHIGLANEFDEPELEDGPYHITVRAINKVDFGGPMATTVCHSMPYIIDRTPPIVHDIAVLGYEEEDCVITAMYNLSDDLSLIKEISFGLGKSPRDIYLLDWEREANLTHIAKPFCVPDGVPAWVKVRAMNHVELTTAGHAPSPIIVDRSPPIAGQVFDGTVIDHDIDFQSFSDKLCVSWSGFYDEDSGIEKYVWYAGTTAGSNDTVSPIELSHFEYRSCSADVDLEHNTTYYSTIVAFNAGHKNLWTNVTTDGVLYDETPPEAGWIKDGEDTEKDMIYSPLASTVSANWDDFSDPESGIDNYVISIWKTNPSEGSQVPQNIHDKESLPAVTRSIKWHHFHLHQSDYVYTEIEAVNKARSPTRIYSDGYTVDLTEPEFIFFGDGIISKVDEKFTSSTSQVGVNWDFEDPESGLDHYKVTVYQTYGGKRKQFYPSDGSAQVIVDGTATSWQSPPVLHMINGGHYSVRVSAINGAGIGNVQDTDGVIVDSTPPRMLKLKIGVLTAGEEEEIFDGYIIQSDTEGIRGYWEAIDFESDVAAYWISIGTYQGGADVKEMSNIGTSKGGYLSDLTLEKYDAHSDHPVYFVSIKAENGAGMMSDTLISRGIKVVSADKVGMVTDGPNDDVIDETKVMHVDVDYQRETGTVTAQFSGFESEQHGIVHYEWAIGTSPRSDEVQPFISDGIIKNEEIQIKGDGLGGSGKAQSLVPLDQSQRYYTTVRAYTGVGNVLDASSDGFTVDTTPPHISLDQSQQSNDSAIASEESSRFQKSAHFITSSWEITEDDSAILITEFCYGTVPGFSDIFNCTDTTEKDYIINALVTPNTHSLPNTLTLRSTNKVGLKSEKYAVGVTIDHSPPVAGIIDCQSSIRTTDDVVCTWINFYDKESGISNYRFAFGLSEGDDSICPFTMVRSSHHEYRVKGPFETGKYFATVVAVNYLGDETYGYSEAIFVDDTPPVAGIVVELNDVDEINYDGHSNGDGSDILGCGNFDSCMEVDAVCQKSVDRIFVAWEPFSDPDSSITRYQVAVGPSPGSTQILDFTDVDTSKGLFTLIRGINLYDVRHVFVAVRGYNQAGLHTTAVSNGVYISRVSSGLPPLPGSHVWDGSADEDLDYQDNNDVLHSKWSFEGDPCKKTKYEWAIYRFDGMLMQNFTTTSDEFGMNDGLDLKDGESYYTVVKATNELGFSEILRSNGITVQLEPLQPGNIRDGPIDGFDLNFQESITSLSANWDSFGVACGIDSIGQREPVFGQIIDHYEVAIGTDSRYASTRDDLHPFVDVGCNTTHTFSDLQLVPRTQVYYVTIRAYSISTAMAETTTNGIRVGYGGQVLSQGEVSMQRYVSSSDTISLSWSKFAFKEPVLFYTWGVTQNGNFMKNITCFSLQNFDASLKKTPYESEFDVYPWTNVGKDTMVEVTGLHLNHKDTYSVVVMATDESGQCSLSVEDFTVDLTPPIEGSVQIGAFGDEAVMYTDREDILTATWRAFYDDESDIDTYAVALYDGMTCVGNVQPQILQDFIEVFANDTEYTFLDLTLKVNQPYYVHLRATNKAGLSTTLVSRPVFVDLREPVAGLIKDGGDFKVDVDYQSVTTVLEGVFLHLPTSEGRSCPSREFSRDSFTANNGWHTVNSQEVWGIGHDDTILFRPSQVVTGNENNDLSIIMTRDVTREKMYSGAIYQTNPDVTEGGKYSLDIIAASGDLSAITSVVFWDGPTGIVGDYDAPLLKKEWFDDDREYDDCALCCNSNNTLDGDGRCLCNCTEYFEQLRTSTEPPETTRMTPSEAPPTTTVPWEIEKEVPPEDTFKGDPSLKLMSHQSMGFQLHPAIEVDGEIKHFIAVWFRYKNESTEPENVFIEQLDFDPSEAWHSYMMEITPIKGELSVELYIDGRTVVYMSGLVPFSENTQFTVFVRNSNGNVASFDDVFNPPLTTASFRNIRFPPSSDALCRFGEPFRSGDNPIIAFYAGIGSEKLMDDVIPFYEVSRPCMPCNSPCVSGTCDKLCSTTEAKRHLVRIDNIELSTNRTVEEDGQLQVVPAVYYITIKAVTGSGRYVVASSDGVYVDDTPPIFDYLYHVDKTWSEDEPVTFQGSNSTIAVRWSAYDIGSQVFDFKWAIGTTPNGTDIQDFVSVGLDTFVCNDELEAVLEDRKTYYVTVYATNNAGLNTVAVTSGVTPILTPPDVSHSNITMRCGNSDIPALGLCGDQSTTGLTWDEVDDDSVEAYYFSIGSTEDTDDVFPMFQVGYNESGTVEIMNGAINIGGEKIANISDVRTLSEDSERDDDVVYKSRFHMEPGRTLVSKITVCNKGHLCQKMAVSKTTITRSDDIIGKPGNDSRIEMTLVGHEAGPQGDVSIDVLSPTQKGEAKISLTAGVLTEKDVNAEYASDASADFKPFVVNPKKTTDKTDRFLRKRIKDIIGPTFYITTVGSVPLKEPMDITVGFNASLFQGDDIEGKPHLLFWKTDTQQWKDASHTCKDTFGAYKYDWDGGILSVQVCSTKGDTSTFRNRRSWEDGMFSGPNQFTLARVGHFVNSPPRITSASKLWMLEDGGTLRYRLTYTDDDGDNVTFSVEPSSPDTGEEIKVSKEGDFRYTPCLDCYGIHDITVTAVEERHDDFEALSTTKILSVDVRGQNDNPTLVFSVDHKSALHGGDHKVMFTIEQRSTDDHSYQGLESVVGAFDPDTTDQLTLLFDPPSHGHLEHKTQHRQINFIDADCSDIANITEDHLTIDTPETSVVVHPCGLVTPHQRDRLAWVFAAVRYMSPVAYIGKDSFKINAVDQEGAHSEVATISVYVLANPCLNGGSCRGPQSDPDCLSKERANGFDGYSCRCPPGFIGEFCETKTNKCQPNPCPYNFTCVDMFDAHSCHCENKDWPCGEDKSASYTAIIVSICGGAVLAIAGMVIAWRRLNRQKKKMNIVAPSPCDITHEQKQPQSDETSDTTRDVEPVPDVEPSDVNDNVTDSEVGKTKLVVKDEHESTSQFIELADMPITAPNEDKDQDHGSDDSICMSIPIVEQRFGFVSKLGAPRMAWMHDTDGAGTGADNEQTGPGSSRETEA